MCDCIGCQITKAEVVGKDLHIQCKCLEEHVYGTDPVFTIDKAISAFKSRHVALHIKAVPTILSVDPTL